MTDDPTLSARLRSRQQEIAASSEEDLTLADRLTRRALVAPTVMVDVSDESGPLAIEIRVPMFGEINDLLAAQARLSTAKTGGDTAEMTATMRDLGALVGALCIDESLDAAFWAAGAVSTDVVMDLIEQAATAHTERMGAARRFRQQAGGHGPRAVRAGVRKNAA